MYFDNFMRLALVSISYVVLIFGLGIIMLRPLARKRNVSDRLLIYFISGHFYVINIIYLLLSFRLNSRAVTIIALLVGALGIRLLYDGRGVAKDIYDRVETLALLARGVYGWKFFWKTKITAIGNRIKNIGRLILTKYLFETIMIVGCFGIQAYYMGYRYVKYATFATSDEPVHLNWIQDMVNNGNLYFDGAIYPYGLHTIVYAVIKVFHFKTYTVYRNFGFIMTMLLLMMLVLLLKKVYRSRYAPWIGVFLYVGADIFNDTAWDRLMYCIPMEYGILFLYPLVIFLHNYICRKEKTDLLFFLICFSLTLYVHSYDGIVALILCFCIGVTGFYRIIRNKCFFKIILFGMLSGIVGMLPIGVGLLTGHELQGSYNWATNVIQGTAEKTNIDATLDETDQTNQTNIESNQAEETEKSEKDQVNTDHSLYSQVRGKAIDLYIKIKEVATTCFNQTTSFLMKDNNKMFIILLIVVMIFIVIRTVLHLTFRSKNDELFLQLGMTFYVIILLIMMCSYQLGLPVVIENYRLSEYVAYAFPLLWCIPLEYIYLLVRRRKWLKRMVNAGIIILTACTVFLVYNNGFIRPMGRCTVVNSNSAAITYYKIMQKYQNYQWTIVSTGDEYSMVLDVGRHGDWLEFLTSLSNYSPDMRIVFPTEDVFFFVEKRPIEPMDIVRVNQTKQYSEITEEDAMTNIGDIFYSNKSDFYKFQRNMIMAKAHYWAKKYSYYFSNEMSIFYEDDDFICYYLKQEEDYLNNLAIDFKYNNNTYQ